MYKFKYVSYFASKNVDPLSCKPKNDLTDATE